MIKKLLFAPLLLLAAGVAAQPAAGWQNRAPEDGVFGAAIEAMHAEAGGLRPSKKPVVVAVIGFGMDVGHNAIKNAMWVNAKEKRNGRDDDKNGWADDIHGWNFLGNEMATLDRISREGDREYLRLRGKYSGYLRDDATGKLYRYDGDGRMVKAEWPDDRAELDHYLKARAESEIAQREGGVRFAKALAAYLGDWDKKLREQFPGRKLTKDDFQTAVLAGEQPTGSEAAMVNFIGLYLSLPNADWDKTVEYAETKSVADAEAEYERVLRGRSPHEQEILGDDPYDLGDKGYGNGNLMAENADYGTMIAGIIAGGDRLHGVAPAAKIMALRVDAGPQDESRVKDVALAIRYAVDKGAQVIQLGRGNTLYPYPYGRWVDEALRYAEQKGVLVVIPVMDLSYDLGEVPFYPNRHIAGGDLTNVITVAASDADGNPLIGANFGATELDIFAPGVDIESAIRGNAYAEGSGSNYAAAMVTGVAAFIKSYFPSLTPAQMRELLMQNVTPHGDAEVEKAFYINGILTKDLFLFDDLSVAGGILNGAKAFEAAKALK